MLKNHIAIPVIKIPTQGSSALRWYTVLLGYLFVMFLQMVSSSSSSWTSWTLKMTAQWSFKHWDTLTHLTQHHILQDLNPYQHHCESIRPSSGCLLAQVNHNSTIMFSSVWLGNRPYPELKQYWSVRCCHALIQFFAGSQQWSGCIHICSIDNGRMNLITW